MAEKHCGENLEFVIDYFYLEQSADYKKDEYLIDLQALAIFMYEKYIDIDSPEPININNKTRSKIKKVVYSPGSKHSDIVKCFRPAYFETSQMLSDGVILGFIKDVDEFAYN